MSILFMTKKTTKNAMMMKRGLMRLSCQTDGL
jgi:hypothetical protein